MILFSFLREPKDFEKTCRTQRSNSSIQVISQSRHMPWKLPRQSKTSSPRMVLKGSRRKCGFRMTVTAMFERLIHPQWAAMPLRLIVGIGFMEHGYAKLVRGPGAFVSILQALGVPNPNVVAWVTILIELLGGLAVFIGAFIPLMSVPLAGSLVVAMLSVHLPYGFSSIKLIAVTPAGAQFGPPGYECDLLYLACLAALVLIGSGPLSVDGLLSRKRRPTSFAKAVVVNDSSV